MVDITIMNSEKELKSFPITQSLLLKSVSNVDTTFLSEYILLFRVVSDSPLISLAPPYSYSISYIKERFDIVPLSFINTEQEDGTTQIEVKPKEALKLDSDYIIYISKDLDVPTTVVTKTVTKSNSSVLKAYAFPPSINRNLTVSVVTTSKVSSTSNLTTFSIDGSTFTIDLVTSPTFKYNNVLYTFVNTVYVQGETFNIEIKQASVDSSREDSLYKFSTVASATIKPLENQATSQSINTQAILDFYKKVDNTPKAVVLTPRYVAPNVFEIELPDGYTLDYTREVELSLKEAFNNYVLPQLGLYTDLNYNLYIYQDGSSIFVEVTLNEEGITQVFNDDEDLVPFLIKRRHR